ncbi:MAG TPA: hypothetical protein VF595_04465 [Tepidisphaeraceae bacterium]|jgi:hypothetical protein
MKLLVESNHGSAKHASQRLAAGLPVIKSLKRPRDKSADPVDCGELRRLACDRLRHFASLR